MSGRRQRTRSVGGFTLIETVVALLIVALGMTAVYMQVGQFASTAILMQDKTLASWIGSNIVTELSISRDWPEFGESEDEIEFANRTWRISIVITETEVENLRRADVSVALADRPERVEQLAQVRLGERVAPLGAVHVDHADVGVDGDQDVVERHARVLVPCGAFC